MANCKNCMELTYSTSRPTSNFYAPNTISQNGDKIFIVYDINATNSNNLEAELFFNNDGKLSVINKISADLQYPHVNGGKASTCFTKFSILDDNGINTARIRLFDHNLNLLTTKLFKDYYASGFSLNGGCFSQNSEYIAVSYVYDPNIGKNYQKTVIRILKSDNLSEVASYKYDGYTHIPSEFFSINNGEKNITYLVTSSTGGKYDAGEIISKAPAVLKILELKLSISTLDLIYEVELPEIFKYDLLKISKKSIYIMIGTNRADISSEVILQNKPNKSFLEYDGDEFRVYKFKNNKLKLINKKNFGLNIEAKFFPSNKIIALIKNNNGCSFIELIRVDKYFCPLQPLQNATSMIPNKSCINFSDNGKWAIITGSRADNYLAGPDLLKNVLLFKINSDCV